MNDAESSPDRPAGDRAPTEVSRATDVDRPGTRPGPRHGRHGHDDGERGREGRRRDLAGSSLIGHTFGGVVIGAAEAVPGVSGGTMALVMGLYDRLIGAADTVVRSAQCLLPGRGGVGATRDGLREVPWAFVLPLLAGMFTALVIGARLLEPLVDEQPEGTRAVFFGLVAASIWVPLRMVGGLRSGGDLLRLLPAAVLALVLVSLPPADVPDPPLIAVFAAATVAVCALVLPGVSGSFFLLSVGLYEPTLAAVNDRDLGYLITFALGAAVGLLTVVRAVRWLLENRRRGTLLVMAGLMLGSLRALWPWQSEDRGLLAPSGGVGFALAVLALAVAGAAVVVVLLVVESRTKQPT